ncbi:MoaD/ThiS family protein [Trichloromonas sp.]|uniref:MoaD/ThiS family protein n=1 Tax=Trichloromonas sp. TaxID=3069249 RepID=UPI003D81B06E
MTTETTAIRMFGALHTIRKERGLKSVAQVILPPEGRVAEEIALELELPLDKIEGVFINHVVYSIDQVIRPGDEVAFVPTGVPGPHRFMLGIQNAGKKK